jgi:hypothetical protein
MNLRSDNSESDAKFFQDAKYCGSDVEDYFEHLYPNMETTVCHEMASYPTHIDVFIQEPNKEIPYYVLFTTGMSILGMTLPDDLQKKKAKLERAELFMLLAKDFDMENTLGSALHTPPLEKTWPVYVLQSLARFPYENKTWLGACHTIGPYEEPIAPDTTQCGVILLQMSGDHGKMKASDGTIINLYCVVPLYREEIEYRLAHNKQEWHQLLEHLPLMVDLHRSSLC